VRKSSKEQELGIIASWVEAGSSVLDLGCGEGELLYRLATERQVRAQGIEIDEQKIYATVDKGVSVLHEDIEESISDFRDGAFDYVVLQQSLTEIVKQPDIVIQQALRVGSQAIVSFGNFVHYRARLQLFFQGRTPMTPSLPYTWYETPNLHFLSIRDFREYCRIRNVRVERAAYVSGARRVRLLPNLFALIGIFLISKG
jgi:methionine biosynthesis protein MetW